MKTSRGLRFEELPDVLTVAETGVVLRIARNAVYEMVHRHEMPAVRIGRRVLILKAGLAEMLGISTNPAPQANAKNAPQQAWKNKLTLRGSFMITLQVDGHEESPGAP